MSLSKIYTGPYFEKSPQMVTKGRKITPIAKS